MSTGLPSGRNGMSSSGTMRAMMPLFPWRPAILSPTEIFRFSATYTFTSWITPGGSSSGWRILSIWSSDFSSILARSAVAASSTARIRSLTVLLVTRSVFRSTSANCTPSSCCFVSLVPWGRYSSTVPALSMRPTSCPASSSASSANIASEMRAFSSASSRRTSPIRSPRSFSTTWSSMREKIFTSMTTPSMPGGTLSDESFTSFAFSPKIAVKSFSSGLSSVSPLGVILPTRMSPALTCAPMRTMPRSSKSTSDSSATFGISRVISSRPRLVSRTCSSSSWIWIDEYTSSLTSRSESTIASSKLWPYQGMNATSTFAPSASSPRSVPDHHRARVAGHRLLEPRTHQRRLREEQGYRLPLHVRAHEGTVRVVVLQERDQGRGDRDELLGRDVHEVDPRRRQQRVVVALAAQHQLVGEAAVLREAGVRLRYRVFLLLGGRQPPDLVGHLAVLHRPIRRLDEAEVVDARVARQAGDQSDVRPFRRLDRAHAAVLAVVHVAHLKARPLARQPARPEGREPALVGQLRQRIRLIHELRQLRAAEERLDHRAHRAGVDQVVERDALGIVVDAHPLLDEPRHARQSHRELVGDELAHRAHPAVAAPSRDWAPRRAGAARRSAPALRPRCASDP